MADKPQKSKKPGQQQQQQQQQQPPQDPEEVARLKAEKARRKAEFEATKGAKIAAEKAAKDQAKKQKGKPAQNQGKADGVSEKQSQQQTPNQKPIKAQKSASSNNNNSNATPTTTPSSNKEKVEKHSSDAKLKDRVEKTTDSMKSLDINSEKGSSGSSTNNNVKTPATTTTTTTSSAKTPAKPRLTTSQSRVQTLFDHLPKGVEPKSLFEEENGIKTKGIDTAFITLGLKYSQGQLQGSNNRVIALLNVIGQFIDSYVTPPEKDFQYDFALSLKRNLEFLRKCRPFAVAMNNTVDFINQKLREINVGDGKSEDEIKKELSIALLEFKEERIDKATEAIVAKAKTKIVKDDVVLIFGSSDLVREVIVAASEDENKSFSIVVIDGRPYATERRAKGLDIINRLAQDGVIGKKVSHVKYTSITGLSNVIRSVTKVILGAHGLLANGGVLAHCGTSQIALMASANNIPVLVCCETLKFCDKSPTDSFFLNEMGTGFGLEKKFTDCDPYLVTPVIKYDVTPPELVTAVITDVDILPCTSVPVVLRVQENRTIKLGYSGKFASHK